MAKHCSITVLLASAAMFIAAPAGVAFADPLDSVMAPVPSPGPYTEPVAGIGTGAELNMIQIQSLMSQRQLAVQLTTELLQRQHDALQGICLECIR